MTAAIVLAPPSLAAHLLAGWWRRPMPAEVETWATAWAAAQTAAVGSEVTELAAAFGESGPEELLDSYERLFVGPGRVPCSPYESLWRGDVRRREQGSLMGEAAAGVVGIYRGLGLGVRPEAHELPDHVAVEWEALAYALDVGDTEAAAALVRDHLAVWMPPFCTAVAAEADVPFYAALAQLTERWTAALTG